MSPTTWLQESYPWTKQPLITNAPMSQYVSPAMVSEVTRAGGLGFLGAGYDIKAAATRLQQTRDLLSSSAVSKAAVSSSSLLPVQESSVLPVGIGVLCFAIDLDDFLAVLEQHRPIAVWLFAARDESDYATWAARIRAVSKAHIWIQTNSVSAAVNLATTAKPDVLVMQGADAGGHGASRGASIVSLIPETVDALTEAGVNIPLIAAGGIADGRGVAAAVALGASGATLGTRFLASDEAAMADSGYLAALLRTSDGGQTTTKSQIFDDVQFAKGNIWPGSYDGRALRNKMVMEAEKGVDLEEARKLFASDKAFKGDMNESRAVAWAGTGVGLVKKVESSFNIVVNAREAALKILNWK